MSDYRYATGTCTVTNGSAVVPFASGALLQTYGIQQGDTINVRGLTGRIKSVDSQTQVTLEDTWGGSTLSGVAYAIYRDSYFQSATATAAVQASQILAKIAGIVLIQVPDASSVPDPSIGEDGWIAVQWSTGKWWRRVSGVWSNVAFPMGAASLGIGGITPDAVLTLASEAVAFPSVTSPSLLHLVGSNNLGAFVTYDGFGTAGGHNATPHILYRAARGSKAAPSAVGTSVAGLDPTLIGTTGDYLGFIGGTGYGATGYSAYARASIAFRPTEQWTDTAQGAQLYFGTTPTGGTASWYPMILTASGRLVLNTDTAAPSTTLAALGNVLANGPGYQVLVTNSTNSPANAYTGLQSFVDSSVLSIIARTSTQAATQFGFNLGGWTQILSSNNGTGTNNGLVIGTGGAAPLVLGTNNIERARIAPAGNIGIETASPGASYLVEIGNGTGIKYVRVNGGNGSGQGAAIVLAGGGSNIGSFGNYSALFGGAYDASFTIFSNGGKVLIPDAAIKVGIRKTAPTCALDVADAIRVGSYAKAALPSASAYGAGAMIYVTDDVGGAVIAFSDATNWRRVTDRAVIS